MSSRNRKTVKRDPMDIPDEWLPYIDNEFIADYWDQKISYTKDFYVAMYKKIHEEHMTYVEAYNALGFNTAVFGTDRANAAGRRAVKMAEENRLFTVDPASYDGSVPREKLGNLTPEEELAYYKARTLYLQEMVGLQKKIPSLLEDIDF